MNKVIICLTIFLITLLSFYSYCVTGKNLTHRNNNHLTELAFADTEAVDSLRSAKKELKELVKKNRQKRDSVVNARKKLKSSSKKSSASRIESSGSQQLAIPEASAFGPELMSFSSSDLLMHLKLDTDGSDASGNGNTGTPGGNYSFVTEAHFDGSINCIGITNGASGTAGGHVSLPDLGFNSRTEFTISIWVKDEKATPDEGLIWFGDWHSGWGGIAHLWGKTIFHVGGIGTSGGGIAIPYESDDLNVWVMYALVYDNGVMKVYKNGQYRDQIAVNVYIPNGNLIGLGQHWWGGNGQGTSTRYTGKIDEARVYSKAFTDSDVLDLYNLTDPDAEPGSNPVEVSTDMNYILEYTSRIAGIDENTNLGNLNSSDRLANITYFDGLGRPVQQAAIQASPVNRADIISPIQYDAFGRVARKFLPYTASANGTYQPTAIDNDYTSATDHFQFYNNAGNGVVEDTQPYSMVIFESSPLNRVLKQGAPGAAWQPDTVIANADRSVKFEYTTNGTGEVYEWEITDMGACKLSSNTHYTANELYVTVTKDENWDSGQTYINDGTVREYKDKLGRVVLKRTYESNAAHDTYYVYDDFGNLRVVLPPEAINQLGSSLENINESNVFTSDATLNISTSQVYYYSPGVTVTLSPNFTGTTGFELKPYPLDAALVENFLFTYKYDERQRMIEKKVPGAAPVYLVYDQRDRLVLTQDGNQRQSNQWTFTKYDQLNRPVLTGTYIKSGDQTSVQAAVDAFYNDVNNPNMYENLSGNWTGGGHGYTDQSYPVGIGEYNYLSVSYYDNYSFTGGDSSFAFDNVNGVNNGDSNVPQLISPKGQATGGKVKVLGDNVFLRSVIYYDKKYRVIQSRVEHYMNAMQQSFTAYDFTGQVTKSKLVHHIDATKSIAITERFEYNHTGRLMKAWHQMDDQTEVLMTENKYNELGELIDKKLHYNEESGTYVQSVDYRYNIRGWLSSINNASRAIETNVNDDSNDLFGMNLSYNADPLGIGGTAQYNGNISAMAWSNASYSGSQHAYNFGYDKLNRLTAANYKEKTGASWNVNTGHFNVTGIAYDQNGNIDTLNRYESNTLIDELEYIYDGNRLLSVNDKQNHDSGFKDGEESAEEYLYDANGNMITDKNKAIQTIEYNLLNLPEKITFENGNYLEYVYDAAGAKLAKKVYENAILTKYTDYVGGMIFDWDTLKIIQTAEGRIVADLVANDYAWDYQYNLKDHLGNNRVVFKSDEVVYTVTMETAYETTEEAEFKNLDKTRYTSATYNYTNPDGTVTSPNKSAMLNATLTNSDGTRRMIGPAKGLKVYQGDVIDMEVWARYNQVNTSETSVNTFLFAAMTASFGVTAIENPQVYSAFNSFIGATALVNQSPGDVPKSFLNYIFFDNNYGNPEFGFVQVNSAASSAHQQLSLSKTINSEGYLYVYVSNESTLNVDVYFDDLKITHTSPSMVVQANDYYPFGLTFNEYQNADELGNDFLYNGKELQKDLNLDWYDYQARYYDPQLGRWHSLDPHAEDYGSWSPYNYVYNNPLVFVDPDGKDAEVAITGSQITVSTTIYIYGSGASNATAATYQNQIMNDWNGGGRSYTDGSGNSYNVNFDVKVQVYDANNPSNGPGVFSGKNNPFNTDNYIEVDNANSRSYVSGGDEGEWRGQGRGGNTLANDNPAAHEFGHIVGLDDRYSSSGADPGWSGNVMAEPANAGTVGQRNIDGVVGNAMKSYDKAVSRFEGARNGIGDKRANNAIKRSQDYKDWQNGTYTYKTKIDDPTPSN